jgi:hypothetical protein
MKNSGKPDLEVPCTINKIPENKYRNNTSPNNVLKVRKKQCGPVKKHVLSCESEGWASTENK